MIKFCEKCGKKTEHVILKNKRYKSINVFFLTCNNKTPANKADMEYLKACIINAPLKDLTGTVDHRTI